MRISLRWIVPALLSALPLLQAGDDARAASRYHQQAASQSVRPVERPGLKRARQVLSAPGTLAPPVKSPRLGPGEARRGQGEASQSRQKLVRVPLVRAPQGTPEGREER